MEEKDTQAAYDPEQAKAFIVEKFLDAGDFTQIVTQEELTRMVTDALALDEAYMKQSGADEGAVYDDDAAFTYLLDKIMPRYPEHKMYLMRFVEDYMDFNEEYLTSIGAIEWE